MKAPLKTPIFAIYLLHFDEPVGRAQHYLGSAKVQRLHDRMLEHACGIGSSLTAELVRSGYGFTLAATWCTSSRDLERTLKRGGHLARFCAICQGDSQQMHLRLPNLRYEPRKPLEMGPGAAWDVEPGKVN